MYSEQVCRAKNGCLSTTTLPFYSFTWVVYCYLYTHTQKALTIHLVFATNTYVFDLSWGWRRVEESNFSKKSKIRPRGLIFGLATTSY